MSSTAATSSTSNWSSLSDDLLRHILTFIPGHTDVSSAIRVCKPWMLALNDNHRIWEVMCQAKGWGKHNKQWFLNHLHLINNYKRGPIKRTDYNDKHNSTVRSGVQAVHVPDPIYLYNWQNGQETIINNNTLVTIDTAPSSRISVWKLDAKKSISTKPELSFHTKHPLTNKVYNYGVVLVSDNYIIGTSSSGRGPSLSITNLITKKTKLLNHHKAATTALSVIYTDTIQEQRLKAHQNKWPNGYLASVGYDQCTWLWDLATGEKIVCLNSHRSNIWSVTLNMTNDGLLIASGGSKHVIIWKIPLEILKNKKMVEKIKNEEELKYKKINNINDDDNNETKEDKYDNSSNKVITDDIATFSDIFPTQEQINEKKLEEILRIENENKKLEMNKYMNDNYEHYRVNILLIKDTMMSLQFDPDLSDTHIYTAGYDNKISHYNYITGECIYQLAGHMNMIVCMKIYEHVIVTGSRDNTVRVWDRHFRKNNQKNNDKDNDDGDEKSISNTSSNNPSCLCVLNDHTMDVKDVLCLNNGDIISGSYDGITCYYQFNNDNDDNIGDMSSCVQS